MKTKRKCYLELPEDDIDEKIDFEERKKELGELVRKVFPKSSGSEVKVLKGGLTNNLYLSEVLFGDDTSKKVLIRTNGNGSEKIINREKELEIFENLSRIGSTKLHCVFKNGIIYDYIEGRPLTNLEIRERKHQKGIAEEVAKMHKIKVDLSDSSISVNVYLEKWLSEVNKAVETMNLAPEILKRLEDIDLKKVGSEIDFLIRTTKQHEDRVVFAHNDLLAGNIIFNEGEGSYKFVDYEYAGWNFRGFDIGDHFAEYMGFECDGFRPSKDLVMNFLKHYLVAFLGREPSQEELDELYVEVMIGTLQSNLMWGVWGLVCSFYKPEDDFDYLTYGEKKIQVYFDEKKIVLEDLRKDMNLTFE